ncbi:MAG: hypothetical protein H7Z38_15100, partial [Rubrivivax sp.]|nr:hypothetical protein [Pyrinomonadaceae bacterium]
LPRVYAPPFRELIAKMRRLTEAGELSAGDSFEFTVEAARNADGTLSDVRFTTAEAKNENWRKLSEEFITLLSDSRALSYLEEVERLTFTVKLADNLSAALSAEAATDARAAQLRSTSALLFDLARHSQQGRPGVEILNGMRVSANGKRLLMKLDMTRAEVGNLLSQSLAIP